MAIINNLNDHTYWKLGYDCYTSGYTNKFQNGMILQVDIGLCLKSCFPLGRKGPGIPALWDTWMINIFWIYEDESSLPVVIRIIPLLLSLLQCSLNHHSWYFYALFFFFLFLLLLLLLLLLMLMSLMLLLRHYPCDSKTHRKHVARCVPYHLSCPTTASAWNAWSS